MSIQSRTMTICDGCRREIEPGDSRHEVTFFKGETAEETVAHFCCWACFPHDNHYKTLNRIVDAARKARSTDVVD